MTSPALRRAANLIARLTDDNSHTKAVIAGLRFLANKVLPEGTTRTEALAKIKALEAIYKLHIERSYILPEEMQYRNNAGEWLNQTAVEHMNASDAAILKGAF